jgi:glycerol-3-phosphate dehydrogenase
MRCDVCLIERIGPNQGSSDLSDKQYDLIVIGAGINGAGIARDAALRGLSVLLLDKTDIGAGTTSWSSRLVHGGLRYLEHAEISLVRESLREREGLLRVAPHLVHPLPLTIPIYEWHRRGPWLIRAGMIAYDVLSFDKSLPRHHMMSSEQALKHEPGLSKQGLRGAARYYDAQVAFPERVAVENAIVAAANGADVRTCAEVTDLLVEAGVVRGVDWRDTLTGENHHARAAVTVNVAGPWVDQVLARIGLADMPRLIGGTKGSHIVVDRFPGASSDALYIEAKRDRRPYFVIPWNGLYLIGTTDIRYESDLDRIVPSEEEIQYLIDETNTAIPSAGLNRTSVHYAYAGLRPLPYQPEGKEGGITRRHMVQDHAPQVEGLVSVIGGKLTTYRSLSEHTVDAIVRKLGRSVPASKTRTATFPGAIGNLERVRRDLMEGGPDWLEPRSAEYLLRVYGTRAEHIVALAINGGQEMRRVVDEETGLIGAAVQFAFREEHARTLADVVMRRTMVGYARGAGIDAAEAIATIAEQSGQWSGSEAADQVKAFRSYMTRFLPRELDKVRQKSISGPPRAMKAGP